MCSCESQPADPRSRNSSGGALSLPPRRPLTLAKLTTGSNRRPPPTASARRPRHAARTSRRAARGTRKPAGPTGWPSLLLVRRPLSLCLGGHLAGGPRASAWTGRGGRWFYAQSARFVLNFIHSLTRRLLGLSPTVSSACSGHPRAFQTWPELIEELARFGGA